MVTCSDQWQLTDDRRVGGAAKCERCKSGLLIGAIFLSLLKDNPKRDLHGDQMMHEFVEEKPAYLNPIFTDDE